MQHIQADLLARRGEAIMTAGPIARIAGIPSQLWLKLRFTPFGRALRRLLNHTPFLSKLLRDYHLARLRAAGDDIAAPLGSPWAALDPDREDPSVEVILARVEQEIEAAHQRGATR